MEIQIFRYEQRAAQAKGLCKTVTKGAKKAKKDNEEEPKALASCFRPSRYTGLRIIYI